MTTNQALLQKKSFQGVPHVGNNACMNYADLNQTELNGADEGKRLVSWLFSNSDLKINRSKLGPSLEDGIVHSCIFKSITNQKVQMTASDLFHNRFCSRFIIKRRGFKNKSLQGWYQLCSFSLLHHALLNYNKSTSAL
jgi:hypothetical protein